LDKEIEISEKTILVTDDEPVNLALLKKNLEKRSYTVIVATNGKECIKKAETLRPDIILLDIKMPSMDGINVCEILKKNHQTQNIPIIFVTADTDELTLKRAFEAGGTDYVRKPLNMIELMARVESALFQQELIKKHIKDEKLKSKLEMAGAICHELNQPLQYLLGISQLLLFDLPEDNKEREHILRINEQVKRMGDITKKLAGITSYKRREYVGDTQIVDINKSSEKKSA
jgi:CheY-like chemotaxis protein